MTISMLDVIKRGAERRITDRRNAPCPCCNADAPLAAWVKNRRFTVECENPDCDEQPAFSANSSDGAWNLWNARA